MLVRPSSVGYLLLGYMLAITSVITLTPFRFSWPQAVLVSWIMKPSDMAANALLFLPLGFLYRLSRPPAARGRHLGVWVRAAALSALFESIQVFLPGRYPSLVDVASNSLGAWLGSVLHARIERSLDARLVRALALELPLMNLVYLLIPLVWLDGLAAGSDATRLWLVPVLGIFGGAVLTAVWRHRLSAAGKLSAGGLAGVAAAWYVMAAFPTLAEAPGFVLASALGLAGLLRLGTWLPARTSKTERRFERLTLVRAFPLYAIYLILASLWPWPWTPGPWRGSLGLADLADMPGVVPLLRLLEQLAGFTLLGYMVAEARGRQEEPLSRVGGWVVSACLLGGAALEALRGFHPGQAASALRLGLLAAAGLYGAIVYRLQLAFVRKLLASRGAEGGTVKPALSTGRRRRSSPP